MPNHELVPAASSARHMLSSIGSISVLSKMTVYPRSDLRQLMILMTPQLHHMCLEHSRILSRRTSIRAHWEWRRRYVRYGQLRRLFCHCGGGVLTTSESCRARSVRSADTIKKRNMQQVAGCSRIGAVPACCRSQLLRPVQHHSRHISFQPAVVRHSLQSSRKRECTCSAGDQDSKIQTSSDDDVRPEISKTKLADKGADNEVPKLGLAGTIATWALLIVSTVRLISFAGRSCRLTFEYFTAKRLVYSATLGVFAVSVWRFLVFHIFTVIPARYATTGCKQSRNRLQLLDTTSSHNKGFGELFVLSLCRTLEHCRVEADKITASNYSYLVFSRVVQCSGYVWAFIFGTVLC